ncbi:MAG: uL15 family ribosomal protein [Patescibacteria group bacterium]|nr:uL15 family ribosomal protein [Patescibacteria group bacterium]MBU1876952.1 uL15 family ribosomal protein [Patescibacteria group bacterium]
MQLHQIKPTTKKKKAKRIGRGGKRGTYCGKGIKGQKSRAGAKFEPAIKLFIKRYHKLKGYRFKGHSENQQVINVFMLEKKFNSGDIVSSKSLIEKKLIRLVEKKEPLIKILGKGDLSKKLIIEGCLVSKSAQEKIEKVGGSVKKI